MAKKKPSNTPQHEGVEQYKARLEAISGQKKLWNYLVELSEDADFALRKPFDTVLELATRPDWLRR